MGTFIIRPTSLASGGTPLVANISIPIPYAGWSDTDGSLGTVPVLDAIKNTTNANLLVPSARTPDTTFTDTLRFLFDGLSIYLDGSPTPIDFNDLPAGFTPLSAAVEVSVGTLNGSTIIFNLQQRIVDNGPDNTNIYPYVFSGIPPSMLDIVSNGCGFKVNINTASLASIVGVWNLRVEGTYELQAFQWTLPVPDDPVAPTDTVRVTSSLSDPNPLDFTQIQTLDIVYDKAGVTHTISIPSSDWITITLVLFIFILPAMPDFPPVIELLITGTQFSGSVNLGKLITIYFTDAPGIYKLVPGALSDTLYDITNGGTVQVKIPNPFFKTGFIGG